MINNAIIDNLRLVEDLAFACRRLVDEWEGESLADNLNEMREQLEQVEDYIPEYSSVRTTDLPLDEGIEILRESGMTVLIADVPEDIDSWPPASVVFGLLSDDPEERAKAEQEKKEWIDKME